MFTLLKNWYIRRFSDPQATAFLAILIFAILIVYFFSNLLAPLFIAIIFAYLLEYPISLLQNKFRLPRLLSVIIVLCTMLGVVFVILFGLFPILWSQLVKLVTDLPTMFNKANIWLLDLPKHYPEFVDYQMVDSIFSGIKSKIMGFAETALTFSVSSLVNLVTLGIYAFLVPFMVFFLLKDKKDLIDYVVQYLPRNRALVRKVWTEMQLQMANYVRGKLLEILIVSIVTYAIFLYFHLNYAVLLSVAVGISVLVPYIGAVLVTIPVALVAIFQFGTTSTFCYLMIAYVITQLLDGNVVVPFLFSEAVNLHPLTIIVSVLIFGGLWGFWGVFFAIPLATLIKAIVTSWPSTESEVQNL
ncbi:AI-2E family transporter [Actinobacillus delphinicola]|uniref:Putative permease n=1 Tax=Actinobacillus delphinicola TaxID=51161 RepID=A0A448TW64_9PAST|nr:AI-2E family transporter [Actinobacillus delphinicola]MDG6896750.1 AI-2E family transporter [Actinobacillus delphinicola]VEJ10182.1 putative permease [Actinobacillus delphinicola]